MEEVLPDKIPAIVESDVIETVKGVKGKPGNIQATFHPVDEQGKSLVYKKPHLSGTYNNKGQSVSEIESGLGQVVDIRSNPQDSVNK